MKLILDVTDVPLVKINNLCIEKDLNLIIERDKCYINLIEVENECNRIRKNM